MTKIDLNRNNTTGIIRTEKNKNLRNMNDDETLQNYCVATFTKIKVCYLFLLLLFTKYTPLRIIDTPKR